MSWSSERVNFESLKPAGGLEEYLLHIAAVEWSLAEPIVIASKDDIKSQANWRDRFEPYHHQVENLIRFCRMLPVTVLADDVGLGKTISAGLVLAELIERKRVARCLVVCPAILGPQWVEEIGSKFGIPGVFATGQELTDVLERSVVPVVVTTYQTVSNRIASIRPDQFDMLILDEAHKLRNLHGTAKPPQMAERIKKSLENRIFKYVMMLTATPIQNRVWDLYSLIDLLTVAKGHRNPLGNPAEFRARYIADSAGRRLNSYTADEFRSILRQYVARTRREDARLVFPERRVETRKLRGGDVERRMYEIVSDEIGKLNSFAQISLGQAMMSSPQALATQLENMAGKGNISQLAAADVRRLADTNPTTAKLDGLLQLVRELRDKRSTDWRLVVFTLRKDTQDAIARALIAEGIEVGFIRGGSSHANQSTVERFRASPPRVNVIVSTDAGAEGVNLQAGNVLVNYDLPWNPMVMEQRIGRIQRLASVHREVIVVNLVIANSVEERVVGRLLEKLQAVAETIGDIETILESSGQDDDASFEEMVRKLVVSSLTGQDVEAATRADTSSIERAKSRMQEERGTIEEMFGPGTPDAKRGPTPPKFDPVRPSITAEQFVMRALTAEGCTLRPKPDDTIDVIKPGKPVDRITFKPEAVEREASGVFMGNAPKLYLPGRPAFERLVQRWLQRSGHCVRDLSANSEALTLLAVKSWCDGLPDTEYESFATKGSRRRMAGGVVCRVKAANGVDSLEKLLRIDAKSTEDDPSHNEVTYTSPVLREQLSADDAFEGIERFIGSSVGSDKDIGEFCRFYEGRRVDEVGKAGADARRRHRVETDFAPKVFADVVAMSGLRYDVVQASVAFVLDKEHRYEADLELIPATKKVLGEPDRRTCSVTQRSLPFPCIGTCSVSGKVATLHLLAKSAVSGRLALAEFTVRCDVTGETLLQEEAWRSEVSGRTARIAHFAKSPMSGRKGLKEEFETCECSGSRVLRDELLVSDISGRRFRCDEVAKSAVSGKAGHDSEFVTCEESGDIVLPEETSTSAVSGAVVRRDLLVASHKPPHRFGRHCETVECAATGHTLLLDEVVSSAVSGKQVDKELACRSESSGRFGLSDEMVQCEVSGQLLLSDETDYSMVSAKRVNSDLLITSPVSGNKALPDECKGCEISGELVLPDELLQSDESGRWFRRDQAATSAESGRVGHVTETVVCSGTRARVLMSESDVSAISGKCFRRSALVTSEKPPYRLGSIEEIRQCAHSGKTLLSDEVVASAVSCTVIDRDIAVYSEVTGLPAAPDEVVHCDESGRVLLPAEAARSDVSKKLVCSDLLHPSPLSGRRGLLSEYQECEITRVRVLTDELVRSDESGRLFRKDDAVTSAESGRVGHRTETVKCCGILKHVLKSEAGESAITGKTYSKSLLAPSEKSPHRYGLATEHITCAKSKKRLLEDEVVKSAVSDQWIDRDLAQASARSGRVALAEELVTCEESSLRLLPEETEVCTITGKRVDTTLVGSSELTGNRALRSRLEACAVSGKLAIPSELQACKVTGKRVDPAELETCTVSHKRATRYQFVRSDLSGLLMLPELAVWSPVSKRCCAPQEAVLCTWRGVPFPKDEVSTDRLTGLTFSRDVLNPANELRPLRDLLDGKEAGEDATDIVGWLSRNLNGVVTGLKSARCIFSPDGSVRAVCGEMRAMLGFKVRYAGLLTTEKGDRQVSGRVVVGKRHQTGWTAEV